MVTTYGVLSGLHRVSPDAVKKASLVLKALEADALVLNGDFSASRNSSFVQEVLGAAVSVGLMTYVVPGRSESYQALSVALNAMNDPRLIDASSCGVVEASDHQVLFVPGASKSKVDAVDSFVLTDQFDSGLYSTSNPPGQIKIINIHDIARVVKHPAHTVAFSPTPPRFSGIGCVDGNYMCRLEKSFEYGDVVFAPGSLVFGEAGLRVAQSGATVTNGEIHLGHEVLGKVYGETNITKIISGTVDYAAGRVHDLEGNALEQSCYHTQLCANASSLDRGIVGLVSVDGDKVAYEPVNFQNHRIYFHLGLE